MINTHKPTGGWNKSVCVWTVRLLNISHTLAAVFCVYLLSPLCVYVRVCFFQQLKVCYHNSHTHTHTPLPVVCDFDAECVPLRAEAVTLDLQTKERLCETSAVSVPQTHKQKHSWKEESVCWVFTHPLAATECLKPPSPLRYKLTMQ